MGSDQLLFNSVRNKECRKLLTEKVDEALKKVLVPDHYGKLTLEIIINDGTIQTLREIVEKNSRF